MSRKARSQRRRKLLAEVLPNQPLLCLSATKLLPFERLPVNDPCSRKVYRCTYEEVRMTLARLTLLGKIK